MGITALINLKVGSSMAITAISAIIIFTTKSKTLNSPISRFPINRKITSMMKYKNIVLTIIVVRSLMFQLPFQIMYILYFKNKNMIRKESFLFYFWKRGKRIDSIDPLP